jgi:hypothetical protein
MRNKLLYLPLGESGSTDESKSTIDGAGAHSEQNIWLVNQDLPLYSSGFEYLLICLSTGKLLVSSCI